MADEFSNGVFIKEKKQQKIFVYLWLLKIAASTFVWCGENVFIHNFVLPFLALGLFPQESMVR